MAPPQALPFTTLDVFTTTPFLGNPLAIVHLSADLPLSQSQKQVIAREFNFSETVFLHPETGGTSPTTPDSNVAAYRIDIFTTTAELPFAGHPTIGTLCHIFSKGNGTTTPKIRLQTRAGIIEGTYDPNLRRAAAQIPHNVHIHIQQPHPATSVFAAQPSLRTPDVIQDGTCPMVSVVKGMTFVLIELRSLQDLEGLQAGAQRSLYQDSKGGSGVMFDEGWAPSLLGYYYYHILSSAAQTVQAEDAGEGSTRIRTRMLETTIGEDPATGSAASSLAAYLALQRGIAGTKHVFEIEQGVEMGRASQIGVEVVLDESGKGVKRIEISGSAVEVSRGAIRMPEP